MVVHNNRPFPVDTTSNRYGIRPRGIYSQQQLNQHCIDQYKIYKNHIYRNNNLQPLNMLHYYPRAEGTAPGLLTQSEAVGYAMKTFVWMSGFDSQAKEIFDSINRLRRNNNSTVGRPLDGFGGVGYRPGAEELMSWCVYDVESVQPSSRSTCATDGDLDMAYALLLAHEQWGSTSHPFDYLQQAMTLIEAIRNFVIRPVIGSTVITGYYPNTEPNVALRGTPTYGAAPAGTAQYRTRLGDWDIDSLTNSRSSCWMPAHFRAFAKYESDNAVFWNAAADQVYSQGALDGMLKTGTAISSRPFVSGGCVHPTTGLVSCFVTGRNPVPDITGGGTTGENYQDCYGYNACRVPWRIASDFHANNIEAARSFCDKLITWLIGKTGGNIHNAGAWRYLNGDDIIPAGVTEPYNDLCFIAPYLLAMSIDSKYQDVLNNWYSAVIEKDIELHRNAYVDGIYMNCLLEITGNSWNVSGPS